VSRVRLERYVDVAAPASQVWDYVTDWRRQGEWVPRTRVVRVDAADGRGGSFAAWTGIGPVGFWDPMTITSWERSADGGGRCEVLHRGRVVRGEGEFSVVAKGAGTCRFVWAEVLVLPLGPVGAVAWRMAAPLVARVLDHALRRMAALAEARHSG